MSLKTFKEAFTTLFIGIIGSLGAGLVLAGMRGTLEMIPGLAILIPAALGARGTIYGALGSKISSNLHLGLIKHISWRNNIVRKNVTFTYQATLFLSLLLAISAAGLATIIEVPASPFLLFFVSVASGVVAGAVLIVLVNFIAFQTFRRGWDPDNITAPLISTLGDFVTVPLLFASALIASRLAPPLLVIIFIFGFFYIFFTVRGNIVTLRFLILSISIMLQIVAGFFLERSLASFLAAPALFTILPAFLAQGGSLASFLASRISTQLHLGILEPEFSLRGKIVYELLTVAMLSILIFPLLGTSAFLMQLILNLPHMTLLETIRITLTAGFLTTLLVAIFLGFSFSILAWRLHLDPDDVTIPILSASADFFGILFLLLVI